MIQAQKSALLAAIVYNGDEGRSPAAANDTVSKKRLAHISMDQTTSLLNDQILIRTVVENTTAQVQAA